MVYTEEGEPIFEGHIPFTHMTTTNAYIGHRFVVTDHNRSPKDMSQRLCEVTVNGAQVLYTLYDERPQASSKPLPSGASALAEKEKEFMESYHKKTGIHWRHYFGPLTSQGGTIGPRPPPSYSCGLRNESETCIAWCLLMGSGGAAEPQKPVNPGGRSPWTSRWYQ